MTRDDKGRFAKGGAGGPGRKPRQTEQTYLDITMSAVSPDQWERIVEKAAQQAERGDAVARKWLSDYLQGLPKQKVEHSGNVGLQWDWERKTTE